jgi:phospholipid/cholesterol/gamma-HCH transport system substrate-binding protein
MNRMRTALVGMFVLGGLLLFGGGLFLIGDRRLLFVDQFELNSTFGKVTGLAVGTQVRVAGLAAGEVLDIALPSGPSDRFRVRMRLREDVRPLVRADSTAAIQTDGIVGNAFIQIGVGTDAARVVNSGDTVTGVDPIGFADLIQEGRDTFRTVATEIIDLKSDVSVAIVALAQTVDTANSVIDNVGQRVDTLTASSASLVEDLHGTVEEARGVVRNVRSGQGTIGQLLTDRELYDRMTNVGREAEQTMRNVRETTDRAKAAVDSFSGPEGTAQQIAQALRNTLAEVQEVTADLAEGTEALKRNFLFRGFFRQRGFFDLDSISREAYQSGVLEGRDRTALKIWLEAPGLFARDADGVERLTLAGRRRLDSAMADFVRYPRDSPLIVEGYAVAGDGEAPYLISADRAQVVRDYLLVRFRRQATLTDIMPLSDAAPGSPRGDGRWSGVALALFVDNDALARPGPAGTP